MTERRATPYRVLALSREVSGLAHFRLFGVVAFGTGSRSEARGLVSLPVDEEPDPAHSSVVPIPEEIDDEKGLLAPSTAAALKIWSSLRLELGDAAVYSEGPGSDLVGQIARWGGGVPVVEVRQSGHVDDPDAVSLEDLDRAVTSLRELARSSPGFAAVDLSGRPEIVDVLLDALPPWGRLLLAARYEQTLTVDFYGDVHRKGAVLHSSLYDPVAMLDGSSGSSLFLRRAFRILSDPERAAVLARLV